MLSNRNINFLTLKLTAVTQFEIQTGLLLFVCVFNQIGLCSLWRHTVGYKNIFVSLHDLNIDYPYNVRVFVLYVVI